MVTPLSVHDDLTSDLITNQQRLDHQNITRRTFVPVETIPTINESDLTSLVSSQLSCSRQPSLYRKSTYSNIDFRLSVSQEVPSAWANSSVFSENIDFVIENEDDTVFFEGTERKSSRVNVHNARQSTKCNCLKNAIVNKTECKLCHSSVKHNLATGDAKASEAHVIENTSRTCEQDSQLPDKTTVSPFNEAEHESTGTIWQRKSCAGFTQVNLQKQVKGNPNDSKSFPVEGIQSMHTHQ